MALEWRDYVIIGLGVLAILGAIYRFIVFKGLANHIMSVVLIGIGLYLFFIVYRKITSRGSGGMDLQNEIHQ